MRITILAVGSRGDVQPYVALGLGLQRAGHEVRLAAPAPFEAWVRGWGLDFAPVEGDPRALLEQEAGQVWLESGRNSLAFMWRMMRLIEPFLEQALDSAWRACQGSKVIISSALGFAGYHIAEKLGVPRCSALLQPASRTRAFPSALVPLSLRLGGAANWLTHLAGEQLFWQPFRPAVNRWRQERLGLPPLPLLGPYGRIYRQRLPFLYGYSPSVVPRPGDWPAWHHVTGYWFLDHPADWQPPADLVDFLAAGPPPVYIGFGSMRSRNAEAVTEMALEALRRAGRRGILLTGWGGLGQANLSDDVFTVDAVPHDWLFPRVAAVVHHGGAGTTAAGLRAGVPSILIPFFADQPFWGQRVAELGAGPAPSSHQRLSVERLATAIRAATTDEGLRARAASLGERIRAEDGVAQAVAALHRYLPERNAPAR